MGRDDERGRGNWEGVLEQGGGGEEGEIKNAGVPQCSNVSVVASMYPVLR